MQVTHKKYITHHKQNQFRIKMILSVRVQLKSISVSDADGGIKPDYFPSIG